MADTLVQFARKRRNRSSGSSVEDKTSSPDSKKQKNTLLSVSDVDSSDEIMAALELTNDVSKKLAMIIRKLEKLDSIESSMKNIEASLAALEARTEKLEIFEASTTQDLDDLKRRRSTTEKECNDKLAALQSQLKGYESKMAELELKEQKCQAKMEELETKDLYLEAYSRRENIKFTNIRESTTENEKQEDTEAALRKFLEDELGYMNASTVELQRVHRLGKRRYEDEPRPILARFLRYKDCEDIFALGRRLRGTTYQMFQDLPAEIVKRRKDQMATLKKAKEHNIPASFSRAQPDKLYIRGKLWPTGKPLVVPGE